MLTALLRFCFALALPAAALACGEQTANDAPIIDSVEAPLVVSERNGAYEIPVTLVFHDNDGEAVTRLHYRLPPNIDGMMDVPSPNPTHESAQLTIVIPVSALDATTDTSVSAKRDDGKGEHHDDARGRDKDRGHARAFQLSVVDGRGAESRVLASTVTLE